MQSLHSFYLKTRHQIYTERRHFFEAFRSDRYSRAGLDGMDMRLQHYIDYENGFFIEAGANDGFTQSNTYWLERFRDWRGILIEPIPALHKICRRERPHSTVYNYALVSNDWPDSHVTMRPAGLMSFVEGGFSQSHAQEAHECAAQRLNLLTAEVHRVSIPARSLSSILDDHPNLPPIDLFSLDVEGFEQQVLEGLDLVRYQPIWLLIETNALCNVIPVLDAFYDQVNQLSSHDYLFRRKSIPELKVKFESNSD